MALSTDTIVIQVLKDNAPVIGASVVLKHTFDKMVQGLPLKVVLSTQITME